MAQHVKGLIIGSGPAGYTAAIYASRANLAPVLYQGNQPGGQLTITNEVENFPGYKDGVEGPQMMMDLEAQAKRFDADIRNGFVTKIEFDKEGGVHKAIVDDKDEITADTVIISTGASARWLGLPSEDKYKFGGGVSACAVCDGFFYKGKDVAIVGAGDSACEEAHYLSKLCKKVYMIVRRDEMRASKIMRERVLKTENIEILWNTSTKEITGEEFVTGATVTNSKTGEDRKLEIDGFFVAIGHTPNTGIFKGSLDMDANGYLITKPDSTKTNIPGVFASGDAQDHIYRQAVTAAGTGCMAALDAERYLTDKELV